MAEEDLRVNTRDPLQDIFYRLLVAADALDEALSHSDLPMTPEVRQAWEGLCASTFAARQRLPAVRQDADST